MYKKIKKYQFGQRVYKNLLQIKKFTCLMNFFYCFYIISQNTK